MLFPWFERETIETIDKLCVRTNSIPFFDREYLIGLNVPFTSGAPFPASHFIHTTYIYTYT